MGGLLLRFNIMAAWHCQSAYLLCEREAQKTAKKVSTVKLTRTEISFGFGEG